MKRALLAVLLMFTVPAWAAPWPQDEGFTVANETTAPLQVVMCEKDGTGCSAPLTFAPGTGDNCGWWIFHVAQKPAGSPLRQCIKYGGNTPLPVPVVLADVCLPVWQRVDIWNVEADWGDVPTSVSPSGKKYGVWRERPACGSNGKMGARMGSAAEAWEFVKNRFKSDAEINAWQKTQPVDTLTSVEESFLVAKKAELAAKLGPVTPPVVVPPVVVPVVKYVVAKNSTTPTRPVYLRVDDTKHGTTEIGRVAVLAPCDATVKAGTTFMGVAGQPNTAKAGAPFAAGAVSSCAQVP